MAALLSQSGQKARRQGSKRKRAVTDECDENSLRAKEIAFKPSQRRSAADGDIDESIRHMDPGILADHISKKFRRFYRDLSSIELEDKYLPQKIFSDTSGFEASRTLGDLPSFLEHFSDKTEDLSTSSERPGSPHTLVIAASGMRAADVTRSLRKFQSQDSAVAKLFAKHIKLPEAVVYVKRTRIGIAVGTPQRLLDLLEKDVLKTSGLKRILIDGSHVDQKKRSIFDMKELSEPLIKLLSSRPVKDKFDAEESQTRVLVF